MSKMVINWIVRASPKISPNEIFLSFEEPHKKKKKILKGSTNAILQLRLSFFLFNLEEKEDNIV